LAIVAATPKSAARSTGGVHELVFKTGPCAFCGIALIGSTQALAQEKLTVWWVRGFYKSEDDALFAAIKKYEDKTASRSSCRNTRCRT
jgi:hypothetical protein